jgi:hypothetical protein
MALAAKFDSRPATVQENAQRIRRPIANFFGFFSGNSVGARIGARKSRA